MLVRFNISPEELTIEMIQNMGKNYINRYGEEPKSCCLCFFPHKSHPVAKKLRDYNNQEATCRERWFFLVNRYKELPSNRGKTARTIRNLFEAVFQVPITLDNPYDSDTELSNHDIAQDMKNILNRYFSEQAEERIRQFTNEHSPIKKSL